MIANVRILSLLLIVALIGCSGSDPLEEQADDLYREYENANGQLEIGANEFLANSAVLTSEDNQASSSPAVLTPRMPLHRYDFSESGVYGYIAAISEDEMKKGKAAGDVVLYAYRGDFDGMLRLDRVDDAGRTLSINECARPCVAIKTNTYGVRGRIAFNARSLIGAAFADAQDGFLSPLPLPVVTPRRIEAADASPTPVTNYEPATEPKASLAEEIANETRCAVVGPKTPQKFCGFSSWQEYREALP